jgi:hypothetical protein
MTKPLFRLSNVYHGVGRHKTFRAEGELGDRRLCGSVLISPTFSDPARSALITFRLANQEADGPWEGPQRGSPRNHHHSFRTARISRQIERTGYALKKAIGYRRLICDRATAGGERFSIVPGALASSPVREVWRSRLWESRARRSSPREPPSIAQCRQHASRGALSIAGKPSIRDGLGPGKSDPELPRALALFVICPFATVAFPHAQFRCRDARLVPELRRDWLLFAPRTIDRERRLKFTPAQPAINDHGK